MTCYPSSQASDGRINVVDFSPDGTRIAAGDIDGRLHVIDVGSGQRLGEPARLHTGGVLDARWLDDATVATTGSDGRVVLYDVRRGLVRGQPIPFTRDGGEDGGYLVTASHDELVVAGARTAGRSFPLSVSSWMAHACQVAGRDLTAAEWASYVPSRPQRAAARCARPADVNCREGEGRRDQGRQLHGLKPRLAYSRLATWICSRLVARCGYLANRLPPADRQVARLNCRPP